MVELEASLAAEPDARMIAHSIESGHPFLNLVLDMDNVREFHKSQNDSGKTYLADFLIASVSQGEMLITKLRARMEIFSGLDIPHPYRIVFDKTTYLDGISPINTFIRYGSGKIAEIDDAFSGNGNSRDYMLTRTDVGFKRLIEGDEVRLNELGDIVRCGIALEAKAHPKQVGPPFIVATLQPRKPVSFTSHNE
jgi:hypothetical protein